MIPLLLLLFVSHTIRCSVADVAMSYNQPSFNRQNQIDFTVYPEQTTTEANPTRASEDDNYVHFWKQKISRSSEYDKMKQAMAEMLKEMQQKAREKRWRKCMTLFKSYEVCSGQATFMLWAKAEAGNIMKGNDKSYF